ncbi:hypothetical protein Emed_000161 [Eimeria media]
MKPRETGYAAAAAASLQQVAKAFEAYLAGRLDIERLLGCMYTAAPGRRGFMQQAVSSSSEDSKPNTKPLCSQLASFAALLTRVLGAAAGGPPLGPKASDGPEVLQQGDEAAYAGICAAEFWLQHVQQLLAFEAATAAAAAAAVEGGNETSTDPTLVYREMENLVTPVAAIAANRAVRLPAPAAVSSSRSEEEAAAALQPQNISADPLICLWICSSLDQWSAAGASALQLPLHVRKAGGEVLLLLAVVASGGPQGAAQGGVAAETRNDFQQNAAGKRRQTLRRVLRKALEGLLGAPGEETDACAAVMREYAVAAAHTVLHWPGTSRRSLRASLGPLGPKLLQTAQQGALMRDEKTAALARSLLCRLTWVWRSASRASLAGDPAQQQQQQQQQQQSPFGGLCVFSHAVNGAQQSIRSLLEASSSGTLVGGASQGPERFLQLRALQLLRDLLLFGGGQAFPSQGAVSTALAEAEASGARFLVLNVQSLGETILGAAGSSLEAVRTSVAAAAAGVALNTQHDAVAAAALQQQQQQEKQQQTDETRSQLQKQHNSETASNQHKQQQQQLIPRRGKGSQKKWKKKMQMQQQQQQQQQQQSHKGPLAALVVTSSESEETETDSSGSTSSAAEDSSDGEGRSSSNNNKRPKQRTSSSSTSSSNGAEAVQSAISRQLHDLQEAELSATSAATLDAAVSAMRALVEVVGPGGLLPNLSLFSRFAEMLFSGCSQLESSVLAARFGDSLLGFVRAVLRCCPSAAPAFHRTCSRFAISVCRQLLSENGWQRAARVIRALALAEDGGLLAVLAETQLHAAATRKPKQMHQGDKSLTEFSSELSRRLAAEDAKWGVETAEKEGLLLLLHGWRGTCCLIEELLRAQEHAALGTPASQLHAFADALVLGTLLSGLACGGMKKESPSFARVMVDDASALIASLRLLTTSISEASTPTCPVSVFAVSARVHAAPNPSLGGLSSRAISRKLISFVCFYAADVGLPPLATLRTASSLQQRLSHVYASGLSSFATSGPSSALGWRLYEAEGDCSSSSSRSAALLQLRHTAAVSGAAASGAVHAALAELSIAIRNAACARSTEGAAAAGEAAVEAGGDGIACRFILRAEELSILHDTSTGVRASRGTVYASSVASSLGFSAPKKAQKPQPSSPAPQETPRKTVASSMPPAPHTPRAEAAAARDCRSLEVASATPSKAAAQAFLSALGVEPRVAPSGDLTGPSLSGSPQAGDGAVVVGSNSTLPSNAHAEGSLQPRKRQRNDGKAARSASPSPTSGAAERKSDDEVVILESTAAPPPAARHSIRKTGLPSTNQSAPEPSVFTEGLHASKIQAVEGLGKPSEANAEAQARARLRQLVQCESQDAISCCKSRLPQA